MLIRFVLYYVIPVLSYTHFMQPQMCNNLTTQVRSIAAVTTAVAKGDLGKKVDIEAGGEIETLKDIVNGMVDQVRFLFYLGGVGLYTNYGLGCS